MNVGLISAPDLSHAKPCSQWYCWRMIPVEQVEQLIAQRIAEATKPLCEMIAPIIAPMSKILASEDLWYSIRDHLPTFICIIFF